MFRQAMKSLRRTAIQGVVAVGVLEVTTHLPSEGRSSELYHYVCDEMATPVLRKLLNPEQAHHLALEFAKVGLSPTYRPSLQEQQIDWTLPNLWGGDSSLQPRNGIGLAAGFDKDAEAVDSLFAMGFGLLEVGSVCKHPQPGNPSPRMFRLVPDQGVINRYGFNSQGVDAVEANLKAYRGVEDNEEDTTTATTTKADDENAAWSMVCKIWKEHVMGTLFPTKEKTFPGLLGINLGKNKDATMPIQDYQSLILQLGPHADYLVINVSCPNVDMKNLGKSTQEMEELLVACQTARDHMLQSTTKTKIPLLVKLSPDLTDEELEDICQCLMKIQIDGIIMSNTTSQRPGSLQSSIRTAAEKGGLSGRPLAERSTECIRKVYHHTAGQIPIIGVGGIFTGDDVYTKLKAGASMVQVYSGMVYRGPGMVSKLRQELSARMLQEGYRKVDDVIGLDHEELYWKRKNEKLKL